MDGRGYSGCDLQLLSRLRASLLGLPLHSVLNESDRSTLQASQNKEAHRLLSFGAGD